MDQGRWEGAKITANSRAITLHSYTCCCSVFFVCVCGFFFIFMFLLPHCEATAVLGTTESAMALARDGAAGKSERFPEICAISAL